MNLYKYIILFIVALFFKVNNTWGQYRMKVHIDGIVPIKTPISSSVKDYEIGLEPEIQFGRTVKDRHEFFINSSLLYIPGKMKNDKYLRFKQTSITGFPIKLGYAHSLVNDLSASLAAGPTFFRKPDKVTGFDLAFRLTYKWRGFILNAGLQRINYHGHMDLFKFGLGYEIF